MSGDYRNTLNRYAACKRFAQDYFAKELREPSPEDYFVAGSLWKSDRDTDMPMVEGELDTLVLACDEVLRLMGLWKRMHAYSSVCESAEDTLRAQIRKHLIGADPCSYCHKSPHHERCIHNEGRGRSMSVDEKARRAANNATFHLLSLRYGEKSQKQAVYAAGVILDAYEAAKLADQPDELPNDSVLKTWQQALGNGTISTYNVEEIIEKLIEAVQYLNTSPSRVQKFPDIEYRLTASAYIHTQPGDPLFDGAEEHRLFLEAQSAEDCRETFESSYLSKTGRSPGERDWNNAKRYISDAVQSAWIWWKRGWNSSEAPKREPGGAKKWEYLHYLVGAGENVKEVLAGHGAQGWELCTIDNGCRYYFKREITQIEDGESK